jgi:HAMP domain-containing protein
LEERRREEIFKTKRREGSPRSEGILQDNVYKETDMRIITLVTMVALVAIVIYLAVRLAIANRTIEESRTAFAEQRFMHEINLAIDAALINELQTLHMRTLVEFGELHSAHATLVVEHEQEKKLHAFLWERATEMWQEYEADISLMVAAVKMKYGDTVSQAIAEYAAMLNDIELINVPVVSTVTNETWDDDGPIPYDLLPKDCEA